ncbi:MAG: MoaD/ThiS family protein [Egibacteraceae bacterium]
MRVTFSATGPLRKMVSSEGMLLDLPAETRIRDALFAVCEQLGEQAAKTLLDDEGGLQRGVLMFLNNEMVPRNGANRALQDGDELTAVMSVAGGS